MTTITEAREAAAAVVSGHAYLPDRVNAPAWVIQPGDPYTEFATGGTFGSILVRFDAVYLASNGANKITATALDEALDDAIVQFINAGWSVEGGGTPEPLEVNAVSYSGFRLSISKQINL